MSAHSLSTTRRKALAYFLLLAGLLLALPVQAKLCGDDVGGQDVPCDCGDTVASSLKLEDDPLLSTTCSRDGLIVRGRKAARPLVIDLNGHTLRGSGGGTGLWILDGGPGGARIVSSKGQATIEGFRDGVVARGVRSVASIEGLVVQQSVRDGVRLLDVAGTVVRNSHARASGRHGFWVKGKGYQLLATRAVRSGRKGYHLMGSDGIVGGPGVGNVAEDSGMEGFAAMGTRHRLIECVASGSGKDGIHVAGTDHEIVGCVARNNHGSGIAGRGSGWQMTRNLAVDNDNNGLVIDGAGIVDAGGNSGRGNRGVGRNAQVVECAIGRTPCLR